MRRSTTKKPSRGRRLPDLPTRRLVLDEQIPLGLASELRKRGYRDAVHATKVGGQGLKDEPLIVALTETGCVPGVLVTFDNDLPYNHRDTLLKCRLPVAIVSSDYPYGPRTQDEHIRQVVHRWAHHMAAHGRIGVGVWYTPRRPTPKSLASLPVVRPRRRRHSLPR